MLRSCRCWASGLTIRRAGRHQTRGPGAGKPGGGGAPQSRRPLQGPAGPAGLLCPPHGSLGRARVPGLGWPRRLWAPQGLRRAVCFRPLFKARPGGVPPGAKAQWASTFVPPRLACPTIPPTAGVSYRLGTGWKAVLSNFFSTSKALQRSKGSGEEKGGPSERSIPALRAVGGGRGVVSALRPRGPAHLRLPPRDPQDPPPLSAPSAQ